MSRLYKKFLLLFTDADSTIESVAAHHNLIRPLFRLAQLAGIAALTVLVIDILFGLGVYDIIANVGKDTVELRSDEASANKFSEKLGPFGDFFGGVLNPIFTFLTFFGLILTIVIQRMELRLAREEYQKTASALTTQAIEATFFNILDLHHKIVEGLTFNPNIIQWSEINRMQKLAGVPEAYGEITSGRAAFGNILYSISVFASSPQQIVENYRELQDRNNHVLGHYFRNLYQALKAIDTYPETTLSTAQKEKYASILRAQLSSTELAVLFINCLDGVVDHGEFKNLLIRYKMLEHLPMEMRDNHWYFPGVFAPIADADMVSQYLTAKKMDVVERPVVHGAFGTNPRVIQFTSM